MRWGLWGWIVVGVLLGAGSASATSYSVRTRWQPSSDPGVTGYRIYMRRAGGAFALALDVGMPALALDGTLTTVHSQSLSGLAAGTVYHYRVKSRDAAGNLATSADATLTTPAAADTTPSVISGMS